MAGFCFQENTHFSQALPCTREEFWEQVRKPSTAWRINARRAILAAVEASKTEGVAALQTWLDNADYQKFLLKKQGMKKKAAKEAWAKKTDAEKLLAFAQEIKDNQTAFIFSCREFDATETTSGRPFCHRRLAECHLNGLVMLDIDHVENPMQIWYQLRDNQELMKRVKMVHITSSGLGLRVVFTADIKEGNLADNQIAFALALGQKPDESCIDATRNSFAPKEEDILFIDETIFDYYNEEFDNKFTPLYRDKKTQPLHHQFPSDNRTDVGSKPQAATVAAEAAVQRSGNVGKVDGVQSEEIRVKSEESKWRGYDIQSIIDQRYARKLPCEADSNRHNESLKLATDLLLMLDGDKAKVLKIVEAQSWVQEIIAVRNENVEQSVESAANCVKKMEEKTTSPQPSRAMQEAILAATGKSYREIIKGEGVQTVAKSKSAILNAQLDAWGAEIEELFPDYPMIQDVCAGLKRSQYPAALFVAGGVLMTLMTRTWYKFYHRPYQERRLNCSLYIIGHPASNKSMADDLYKLLSSPMSAADKAGKSALNRYKQDMKKKAANKEGKDKPQGIIRVHPARTSNGQLIQDMINAKETIDGKEVQLHMFTFDTELDNATTLQQGGSWINKQSMELKAFHNEEDGQMYQNSDSPVDEFNVTWNYIYSGTPIALKRKVNDRNFGSGLSTRLAVIPMPKTNCEMIAFEEKDTIDWQRLERMKEWAFKLDTRFGELPLWPLVSHLYDWTAERFEECLEESSEDLRDAIELMLKRIPYHALNYSAPFIDIRHWDSLHQDGGYWKGEYEVDETDWKLCELIARIQYGTQQRYFSVMAEKYFTDMNNDVSITDTNVKQKSVEGFSKLPDPFTKEDVMRCFEISNPDSARKKIYRFIKKKCIEQITEGEHTGCYKKLVQVLQ